MVGHKALYLVGKYILPKKESHPNLSTSESSKLLLAVLFTRIFLTLVIIKILHPQFHAIFPHMASTVYERYR